MWDGWTKNIGDNYRVYSLVIESGIQFLLEVHFLKLTNAKSNPWKVSMYSFHPLSGDEVIFEETFPNLSEAETVAWMRAFEEAKDAYDNP